MVSSVYLSKRGYWIPVPSHFTSTPLENDAMLSYEDGGSKHFTITVLVKCGGR